MITLREHFTILIIEDDPGHARLLEISLKRLGLPNPVVKIDRGDAAIRFLGLKGHKAALAEGTPLLLFLDLNLPGNSGLEVLECLRAEAGCRYPVIIVTSSDDPHDRERSLELGSDDYLLKPPGEGALKAAFTRLGLLGQES